MLQQDYLLQLFAQFVQALIRSKELSKEQKDPLAAAESLELAIEQALSMDAAALLSLDPYSMASVVQLTGVDPRLVDYIACALVQEADCLQEANQAELAQLRCNQAEALLDVYQREPKTLEELR